MNYNIQKRKENKIMNAKYLKDNLDLEWGNVTKEDILRRVYKGKTLEEMSEKEIDKMLDDLI